MGAAGTGSRGELLALGRNRVYSNSDYTAHAKIEVLRKAGEQLMTPRHRETCTSTPPSSPA